MPRPPPAHLVAAMDAVLAAAGANAAGKTSPTKSMAPPLSPVKVTSWVSSEFYRCLMAVVDRSAFFNTLLKIPANGPECDEILRSRTDAAMVNDNPP